MACEGSNISPTAEGGPLVYRSAGGVSGYGAKETSIGECLVPSDSTLGEAGIADVDFFDAPASAFEESAAEPWSEAGVTAITEGIGGIVCKVMTSFSFFLYLSLSFRARSKSLLRPRIIALCLSTNRHNWVFCCDCDCFSFSRY
jgi:hypothetical protein